MKSAAFPPGNMNGPLCKAVLVSVKRTGSPPAPGTVYNRSSSSLAKTIRSLSPQLAPRMVGTSAMVTGGPPAMETLRNRPSPQYATQRPSGEKNGLAIFPSVPGISSAPRRPSSRR